MNSGLSRDSVGLGHVVFFVVAAAAPLTAMVGASPAAIAFGNGPGVPGVFVLAGGIYLLFSVGFTAMCRFVPGGGAFYVYVTRGLGKPLGFAAAMIVLVAYNAIQVGIYALMGVFAGNAAAAAGVTLPWWAYSAAAVVVVTLLGRTRITLSGSILGTCMIAEVLILSALDVGILLRGGGPDGVTLAMFRPAAVFAPGLGAALVFVIGSYVGFEATAIFAEEARDAPRTVPRATYAAVVLITVFYAFSTWAIVDYYGLARVKAEALATPDTMFFTAASAVLGPWAAQLMRTLLIVSLFACVLSFHSTVSRYYFALGREGTLPTVFGEVNPVHQAPCNAGLLQSATAALILGAFIAGHADPFAIIFGWMSALATLGILTVQVLVSASVIRFLGQPSYAREVTVWVRWVAPLGSTAGLSACIYFVTTNITMLAGSDSPAVRAFPALIFGVGFVSASYAMWLRGRRPARYAALGRAYES